MKGKYLTLIVMIFEQLQPITLSTIEEKKKNFREKILEQQKQIEQSDLITKKDFLNNCAIAVDELKNHVLKGVKFLREKKSHSLLVEKNLGIPDVSTFKLGVSKSDRKKELDVLIKNANELYGKNTHVDLKPLVRTTEIGMCLNDVEFIESVFDNINFVHHEEKELDLHNFPKISAVQKVIYLNELGIIDFLRSKPEFNASTNLMASILSSITGEKASTLQTSLNRLISKDIEDKNHPYSTKSTVNKVLQTLINKDIETKTKPLN